MDEFTVTYHGSTYKVTENPNTSGISWQVWCEDGHPLETENVEDICALINFMTDHNDSIIKRRNQHDTYEA